MNKEREESGELGGFRVRRVRMRKLFAGSTGRCGLASDVVRFGSAIGLFKMLPGPFLTDKSNSHGNGVCRLKAASKTMRVNVEGADLTSTPMR